MWQIASGDRTYYLQCVKEEDVQFRGNQMQPTKYTHDKNKDIGSRHVRRRASWLVHSPNRSPEQSQARPPRSPRQSPRPARNAARPPRPQFKDSASANRSPARLNRRQDSRLERGRRCPSGAPLLERCRDLNRISQRVLRLLWSMGAIVLFR